MPEKQTQPRIKSLDLDTITLPEIELPYLIDMLQSLGFASAGFNGAQQITWQEFRAWQEATGAEVTPWEAETVIQLSGAYVAMLHKAKDPACRKPFIEETDEERQARLAYVDDFFFKPSGIKPKPQKVKNRG